MREEAQADGANEPRQYVIIGLGNPGKKYALTRHNLGYLVVQAFAEEQGWGFKEEARYQAHVAKGKVDGATIHLLLSTTYMNESGRAVRPYLDFYRLGPRNLRVVSDDVALGFGEMRVRNVGSAGGHNGLKSIEAYLQTQHYVRLRMGIGRGGEEKVSDSLADYVLDTFTAEEMTQLPTFVKSGVTVLKRLVSEEVSVVMNVVNKRL